MHRTFYCDTPKPRHLEYFQASRAAHAGQALAPREVILSSWLVESKNKGGAHE